MGEVKFYVLMRSDLKSMNAGRAAAQATHAQAALFTKHPKLFESQEYKIWMKKKLGFGKTIVLDAYDLTTLKGYIKDAKKEGRICGLVTDPTYTLQDGDFSINLPVVTCGYILTEAYYGLNLFKGYKSYG